MEDAPCLCAFLIFGPAGESPLKMLPGRGRYPAPWRMYVSTRLTA